MNGFELCREIKKIGKKVKVCFLTAGEMYYEVYTDIFDEKNQFIRKPIENAELITVEAFESLHGFRVLGL
jgi:CheY-like chemotaxis protein